MMTLEALIQQIQQQPDNIDFADVIEVINSHYDYQPARFSNGLNDDMQINAAGTNEGSCKIFAFGQLNHLDKDQLLACFGRYYRDDVLKNPGNTDHANIRNFITYGWPGIHFESQPLSPK